MQFIYIDIYIVLWVVGFSYLLNVHFLSSIMCMASFHVLGLNLFSLIHGFFKWTEWFYISGEAINLYNSSLSE